MKRIVLGLACFACLCTGAPALAAPDCSSDNFSGESSCTYGRKSIGLPGIGNQVLTKDGQMTFVRLVSRIGGDPVNVDAVLFRVDDRRTIQLPATNLNRPSVNCTGAFCTWTWNVAANLPGPVLAELASAKKLVIGFRGDGQTIEEQELRRGGQIFKKFQDDIQKHEPGVLTSAGGEAFLMQGQAVVPYAPHQEASLGWDVVDHKPLGMIDGPDPIYPPSLIGSGIAGTTIVEVDIGADAKLIEAKTKQSSGNELLDASALDAVRQWNFGAAFKHGASYRSTGEFMLPFEAR